MIKKGNVHAQNKPYVPCAHFGNISMVSVLDRLPLLMHGELKLVYYTCMYVHVTSHTYIPSESKIIILKILLTILSIILNFQMYPLFPKVG